MSKRTESLVEIEGRELKLSNLGRFEPVLKAKQKLPPLERLRQIDPEVLSPPGTTPSDPHRHSVRLLV